MAKSELPNILVQSGSNSNNSGSRDGEIGNCSHNSVSQLIKLEEDMQEACAVSSPVAIHIEDRDDVENCVECGNDNEETSNLMYDYALNLFESRTVKQSSKSAFVEERDNKGEKFRARSSRVKLLVRSQAIQDDTSPPPELDIVTANNNMLSVDNIPLHAQTQSRTSSRHDYLGKQSSSQSSNDGSTSSLSRDSSTETYTDSTGVDLQQFIIETLHKNQKDKMMLMKLEHDFTMLIKDNFRQTYKFPQMSSYNRMLVHRVAAFFGLEHNVDHNGTAIIVNKSRNTRIPDFKFSDQVRDDLLHEEPKKMILKRDNSSFEDGTEKMTEKQYLDSRRSKSFEEREEEYQKAKARIFNKEDQNSVHSEGIMILSHSQEALHTDGQLLIENGDDSLKYSSYQYNCQQTNEVEEKQFEKVIHATQSKDLSNEYRRPMIKSHSFGGVSVLISENSSTKGNNTITKADSLNTAVSGNLCSTGNMQTIGNIAITSSSPTVSLQSESVIASTVPDVSDKATELSDVASPPLTIVPPVSQQLPSQACNWINVEEHQLPIAIPNSACPKNGSLPTSSIADPSTSNIVNTSIRELPNAKDEIPSKKPVPNGTPQPVVLAHFQQSVATPLIAPNQVHPNVPVGQLYQQQFIPAVVYIPCISTPNQQLIMHPSLVQQQSHEQRQNCSESTSSVGEVTNQVCNLNIDAQPSSLPSVNSHSEETRTSTQGSPLPLLKTQNTIGHPADPTCFVQHGPGLFPIHCLTTTAGLFQGNNSMVVNGSDVSQSNEDEIGQSATQPEKCSANLPNGNVMLAPQTGSTASMPFYSYASGFQPSVITTTSGVYHYPIVALPNANLSNSSQVQQNSLLVSPSPLPTTVSSNAAGLPSYMLAGTTFPHHSTNTPNTPYNTFRPQTPPLQNVTTQPHPAVVPQVFNFPLYQPLQNQHSNTFKCPNTVPSNPTFARPFPTLRPNIPLVGKIPNNNTVAPPRFTGPVLMNQANFTGNKPGDLMRVKNGSSNSIQNSQKARNNQLQLSTQFVTPSPNLGPVYCRGYSSALQDIQLVGHPLQHTFSSIMMSQPHHTGLKHNHSRHSKSRKHRDKGTNNAGNRGGFSNNNMQDPKTSNNTLQVEGFPDGMKKNEMERYLELVTNFGGKIQFISMDGRLCDGSDIVIGSKHQVLAVFESSTVAQSALLNIKTNKFQLRPLRRKDRNSSKNIQ